MKINIAHTEKIQEAVKSAEHGCSARLLNITDLAWAADKAEKQLSVMGIPKAKRQKCRVQLEPSKPANSYRGIPYGTYATIERGSEHWFLVSVHRGTVNTQSYGGSEKAKLELSAAAHESIPWEYVL